MAWTVTLTYDTDVLSLQSHAVDNIWGDATTTEEAGQLGLLMNCAADCDATNTAVTGQDIPILTATLRVSVSAAAQTLALASAISLRVNAMLNFGNNFIVQEGQILSDHKAPRSKMKGALHSWSNDTLHSNSTRHGIQWLRSFHLVFVSGTQGWWRPSCRHLSEEPDWTHPVEGKAVLAPRL